MAIARGFVIVAFLLLSYSAQCNADDGPKPPFETVRGVWLAVTPDKSSYVAGDDPKLTVQFVNQGSHRFESAFVWPQLIVFVTDAGGNRIDPSLARDDRVSPTPMIVVEPATTYTVGVAGLSTFGYAFPPGTYSVHFTTRVRMDGALVTDPRALRSQYSGGKIIEASGTIVLTVK